MSQTEVQLIKSSSVVDGDIVGMSSSKLSGTLPAVSGANLTNLPAANLTGALPAISGANLTGISAGITMADSWRITEDFTNNATPISNNWERGDTSPYEGYLGSAGMTESSGVFTFPSTGWYFVNYSHDFRSNNDMTYIYMYLQLTNDNGSNWTDFSFAAGHRKGGSELIYDSQNNSSIFDITNVSTQKMRFVVERQGNNTLTTQGNSTRKQTGFDILRIGDT